MTVHELNDGEIFRFQNELYRLVSLDDNADQCKVVCIGRRANERRSFNYVTTSHEENFNTSAEIDNLS